MAVHIGKMIHEKVKGNPLSVKEVARRINKSENTLYDIYKRENIDTELLLKLSEILGFNFFALYDLEEPIKSMRADEFAKLRVRIAELEEKILLQNEHIDNLKDIILTQKEAKQSRNK